jgi:hypothetical protein
MNIELTALERSVLRWTLIAITLLFRFIIFFAWIFISIAKLTLTQSFSEMDCAILAYTNWFSWRSHDIIQICTEHFSRIFNNCLLSPGQITHASILSLRCSVSLFLFVIRLQFGPRVSTAEGLWGSPTRPKQKVTILIELGALFTNMLIQLDVYFF